MGKPGEKNQETLGKPIIYLKNMGFKWGNLGKKSGNIGKTHHLERTWGQNLTSKF